MTKQLSQGPGQQIPVRQPQFKFDDTIPRYWFQQNPVVTHSFNGLNLLIPVIERFFVRSVIRLKPQIDDPVLKAQIKGFIGQESIHARVHEAYFEHLRQQGYKIDTYLRWFTKYHKMSERMGSAKLNIATTAAAEHYTVSIAHLVLTEPALLTNIHPTMRRFIVWHSAEEIEHKTVAFDVMQAAGVSYFQRLLAYFIVSFDILLWNTIATLMLLRQDRLSFWEIFSFNRQFHKQSKHMNKKFRRLLSAYLRKNFHPDQLDELPQARVELNALDLDIATEKLVTPLIDTGAH